MTEAESKEQKTLLQRMRGFALRQVRARAKDVLLWFVLPTVYRRTAKCPVAKGRVVFLENKESSLPESFTVMWAKLSERPNLNLEFISLGETRVRLRCYYRNCITAVKDIATAQYVFLNDASNVVSCLPLRPETKVVQLWHGCGAFKKWGMSTADLIFGGSRKEILRHPFYKNLSLVTVSSPEVAWAYEEAMVLQDEPGLVQPTGVSRTDVFFDDEYLAAGRSKIQQLVPTAAEKKIVVYAPTFRGRVAHAEGPNALDLAKMKASLGDSHLLLIKHHPFVKERPSIPADCADFAFDVSDQIGINELLCGADLVISDYSSLVFEYSLFERPMIFFAYDRDEYADWRGFYYDYETLAPGPICVTTEEVIEQICLAESEFDPVQIRDFRQKFMSACDGRATERIVQKVFGEKSVE